MRLISRRTRFSHAAVAVTVIALAAAGCGKSSSESSSSSDKNSSGYSGKGIGLAYDIGGKGDQSFNDAAYAGFQKAESEFKLGGRDIEPQDGESDADKVQRLETLAKSGYNPVIGVGFAYAPAVKEVSVKYPKVTFGIIDDNTIQAKNVADMVFHEEQSSYLAGVAAAKTTRRSTSASSAAWTSRSSTSSRRLRPGRQVGRPEHQDRVAVPDADAPGGRLLQPGQGQGRGERPDRGGRGRHLPGGGPVRSGRDPGRGRAKVWAIGVDSDQYQQSALAKYKDYILGSALKNVGGAVYDLTKSVVDGKPLSGEVRGDLKSGGVGFADTNPKYQAMKDVVAAVDKAKQDIIDGKITVNTK